MQNVYRAAFYDEGMGMGDYCVRHKWSSPECCLGEILLRAVWYALVKVGWAKIVVGAFGGLYKCRGREVEFLRNSVQSCLNWDSLYIFYTHTHIKHEVNNLKSPINLLNILHKKDFS